jgi:hypothetical protein
MHHNFLLCYDLSKFSRVNNYLVESAHDFTKVNLKRKTITIVTFETITVMQTLNRCSNNGLSCRSFAKICVLLKSLVELHKGHNQGVLVS